MEDLTYRVRKCDLCNQGLEEDEDGVRCKDCTRDTMYFLGCHDA